MSENTNPLAKGFSFGSMLQNVLTAALITAFAYVGNNVITLSSVVDRLVDKVSRLEHMQDVQAAQLSNLEINDARQDTRANLSEQRAK